MVLVGGLALAFAASPPVLAAPKLRTAVIAVSADHVEAGALQRELEATLSSVPGIELIPSSRSAPALAGATLSSPAPLPTLPPPDPAQKREWERRFDEVANLYVQDELDAALRELVEIDRVQAGTRYVPASERARLLLWRATIHLAQGDASTAEQRVRSAVAIDPKGTIDAAVFPPSVRKIADAVRLEGFRPVKLTVVGAPPGSVVLVDGRPVDADGVLVGQHVVAVGAPGFRWVELPARDIRADVEVDVPLPLAPPAALEQTLRDMSLAGSETIPETKALQELASILGADALVLATHVTKRGEVSPAGSGADPCATESAGERRITGVFWRNSKTWSRTLVAPPRPYPDDSAGRRAFALWLDGVLSEASRGLLRSLGATAALSGGFSVRHDAVRDDHEAVSKPEYETAFMGVATGASVGIAPGRWLVRLDGFFNHYGAIGVQVLPEGEDYEGPDQDRRADREASGGWMSGGRVFAGRRFLLTGDSFRNGYWWSAEAFIAWEKLKAQDIDGTDGGALGFFPSHDRTAGGLRVRGGGRVPKTPLEAEVGLLAFPFTRWLEIPEGTSGTRPHAEQRPGLEALVRWVRPQRKLQWAAVFQAESVSVTFGGRARAPVDPVLERVRRDENRISLVIRAEWSP